MAQNYGSRNSPNESIPELKEQVRSLSKQVKVLWEDLVQANTSLEEVRGQKRTLEEQQHGLHMRLRAAEEEGHAAREQARRGQLEDSRAAHERSMQEQKVRSAEAVLAEASAGIKWLSEAHAQRGHEWKYMQESVAEMMLEGRQVEARARHTEGALHGLQQALYSMHQTTHNLAMEYGTHEGERLRPSSPLRQGTQQVGLQPGLQLGLQEHSLAALPEPSAPRIAGPALQTAIQDIAHMLASGEQLRALQATQRLEEALLFDKRDGDQERQRLTELLLIANDEYAQAQAAREAAEEDASRTHARVHILELEAAKSEGALRQRDAQERAGPGVARLVAMAAEAQREVERDYKAASQSTLEEDNSALREENARLLYSLQQKEERAARQQHALVPIPEAAPEVLPSRSFSSSRSNSPSPGGIPSPAGGLYGSLPLVPLSMSGLEPPLEHPAIGGLQPSANDEALLNKVEKLSLEFENNLINLLEDKHKAL